ncbi:MULTISPECIES: zinc-binding dehydrogenase [Cupriavidus]|uniref:Alcohol dehydrogenase catalytic domain-containing protein n=1 Tax=Cupriavidus basilensis TaxID=68895 RepID=A0A643G1S0_9BURK|nr:MULTISPECIES: alcohol dehydrogenase catalytic domain-containing protein [Cupriavidus]KUE88015.1 alcohol dehydrogenase [Cupriavidus necator]NOV23790.1 NAD(P)-dependent alcohol dehydrogenase [Cupriavidus necator]QOT81840.1 alcohol dehydrogenase catalytic domain-containing protein [Cupriavidus basilensis]BDB30302.1 alcohol dehydrogenase catalytic domain-containing protein [Cupriavidus sp. P-10]
MATMKATVFVEPGRIALEDKPIPDVGPTDALIRITTTTICGTDIHILKGEYPVEKGLTLGHEPIGIIEKLGSQVKGYHEGQRVLCAAVTPCGQCSSCLMGFHSQCGSNSASGWKVAGGWKIGNYLDGCQAEYFVVPDAQANLTVIPDNLTDEDVLLVPDIVSTGFSAAESAGVKIGDVVVVVAQGPIGLCATSGARLMGAGLIIAVDPVEDRLQKAKTMGADVLLNPTKCDVVEEVMKLTQGVGADVALECLGRDETIATCVNVTRPGGTISSVGIYSKSIPIPLDGFGAGLANKRIVTSTCPGGKERMRRLLNVVSSQRIKLDHLVTHTYSLDDVVAAYELFGHQRDGVVKLALKP